MDHAQGKRKRSEDGSARPGSESEVDNVEELGSEDTDSEYPAEEEARVAKELEEFVVDEDLSVEDIQALYDYVVTVGKTMPAVRDYLQSKINAAQASAHKSKASSSSAPDAAAAQNTVSDDDAVDLNVDDASGQVEVVPDWAQNLSQYNDQNKVIVL